MYAEKPNKIFLVVRIFENRLKLFSQTEMALSALSHLGWIPNVLHQIPRFLRSLEERQDSFVNGGFLQDEDSVMNVLVVLAFIIAYTISIQIAISGIFRKKFVHHYQSISYFNICTYYECYC